MILPIRSWRTKNKLHKPITNILTRITDWKIPCVLCGERSGRIWKSSCWEKGNFIITIEFKYGQTWEIWPSALSLSLYCTFNKPLLMVEIVVNWFEYVSVIFNLFGIKVLILSLPKVTHTITRLLWKMFVKSSNFWVI